MIPSFRTVGGDKDATDIQLFQLPADFDSGEAYFQFLTAQRRRASIYNWVMAEDASYYKPGWPEGKGLWVDENDKFPEETVTVAVGNAVQLDMGEYDEIPLQVAGQVSDADLTFTTRAGYNFIGNPYPTPNDIQNIQLPADFDSGEAYFQFLTAQRRRASIYNWVMAEDASYYKPGWPEGLGLWTDENDKFPATTVTMKPGEAVQLDMGEYDKVVLTVYAPIEL